VNEGAVSGSEYSFHGDKDLRRKRSVIIDFSRCEPFRLLVAGGEVALFLYLKVDTCPLKRKDILLGKGVSPFLNRR